MLVEVCTREDNGILVSYMIETTLENIRKVVEASTGHRLVAFFDDANELQAVVRVENITSITPAAEGIDLDELREVEGVVIPKS